MKTTRIQLKVPFYKHPAGTVFDLDEAANILHWEEDERLREKLPPAEKAYFLPDGGRGFGVWLRISDTQPCPEKAFKGVDVRRGDCWITKTETTLNGEPVVPGTDSPCGFLKEEQVQLITNEALNSQGFEMELPPFAEVPLCMILHDRLRQEKVLEYELRNYTLADTQLKWDVTDLHPGFYQLIILFPDHYQHHIYFIKFFPVMAAVVEQEEAIHPLLNDVFQKMEEYVLTEDALKNITLDLCLEWGEYFNQPTQTRLLKLHPEVSAATADELDTLARKVRSFVYELCEKEMRGEILDSDIHFETKRQYPWVNAANFNRMKNVGMYYARR